MQAHKTSDNQVLLMFDKDVGIAIKKAYERDYDSKAIHIARAAQLIRQDIFAIRNTFNGTFSQEYVNNCVPSSLVELVNMILYGPEIRTSSEDEKEDAKWEDIPRITQTIADVLSFNSIQRQRKNATSQTIHRHNKYRETPSMIYIALKLHATTRKRELVDTFHKMGLCISYGRLLSLSADVVNAVLATYEASGLVCPPKLIKNVFLTGQVDNIDHNPSSTTAKSSFHGTGISMIQHPMSVDQIERHPNLLLIDTNVV
jgi:hypothetical protein